ncbi:hypothetical protein IJ384_06165 [bacterium]|nr:hypothetical protein [bacterium]
MNRPKTEIATYTNRAQSKMYHHNHYCPQCDYNQQYLSKTNLNALEQYAMNKIYRRDNDLKRLERLENLAFGATQIGDIQTRYQNVENAILSRPKYNTKQSLINNLANYFSGQTTGFTPNLGTYNNYNNLGGFYNNPYLFTPTPSYNNNRFESYSNGIFGGGWGISGQNFGNGSTVRILD